MKKFFSSKFNYKKNIKNMSIDKSDYLRNFAEINLAMNKTN